MHQNQYDQTGHTIPTKRFFRPLDQQCQRQRVYYAPKGKEGLEHVNKNLLSKSTPSADYQVIEKTICKGMLSHIYENHMF